MPSCTISTGIEIETDTDKAKSYVNMTAATLILKDIKACNSCKEHFSSAKQTMSEEYNKRWVLDSLQLFLNELFDQKKKAKMVLSIGQAIVRKQRRCCRLGRLLYTQLNTTLNSYCASSSWARSSTTPSLRSRLLIIDAS